jgi:hypothetical protein
MLIMSEPRLGSTEYGNALGGARSTRWLGMIFGGALVVALAAAGCSSASPHADPRAGAIQTINMRSEGFWVTVPRDWKRVQLTNSTREHIKAALGNVLSDSALAKPQTGDITSSAVKGLELVVAGPGRDGAGDLHQNVSVLVLPTCPPGVSAGCAPGVDEAALVRLRNDMVAFSPRAMHVTVGHIGTLNGQPCFKAVVSFPSWVKTLGGIQETEYHYFDDGKIYVIGVSGASPGLTTQIAASFTVVHPQAQ